MRLLRASVAAVVGLTMLFAASPASAQIGSVAIGPAEVSPDGTLNASVTVVCDLGFNLAFYGVTVSQSSGYKLANGAGRFDNTYPGVPCTGNPQTQLVAVSSITSFAFKPGTAEVSADVSVFNPNTGAFVTSSVGPTETRILKSPSTAPAPADSVSVETLHLLPDGSVNIPITVVCDVGFSVFGEQLTVVQVSGHNIARSDGLVINSPATACTGAPQTITVPVSSSSTSFAFKEGKATTSGLLGVCNPFCFSIASWGPIETRVVK